MFCQVGHTNSVTVATFGSVKPLGYEKILRQHESTFVDPAAGGQRLSARDTGSGYPNTQITEMSTSC